MTIQERIKMLREECETPLTQTQLGEKLHMSQKAISRLETGEAVMKKGSSLCLVLILIFALFTACRESEPDRSYEKIAHECDLFASLEGYDEVIYQFDPVTCYDDVVLCAKQYYYMSCGVINNDPYTVVRDENSGVWIYFSGTVKFNGRLLNSDLPICGNAVDIWEFFNYQFMVTDEGDVIFGMILDNDSLLNEPISAEGIEFDLSNEFEFSYDDIMGYETHPMFIEKLEPVSGTADILERARYLHGRMGQDELNPYAIAYDSENDCWLYWESVHNNGRTLVTFVIENSGQLLAVYMRE